MAVFSLTYQEMFFAVIRHKLRIDHFLCHKVAFVNRIEFHHLVAFQQDPFEDDSRLPCKFARVLGAFRSLADFLRIFRESIFLARAVATAAMTILR